MKKIPHALFCLAVSILLPFGLTASAVAQSYSITDLGPITSGDTSSAAGINGVGQVCGRAGDHAAVWDGTAATDLGTLADSLDSDAVSLNTAGQVAGSNQFQAYPTVHACVWTLRGGGVQDCGTLGGAFSQARASTPLDMSPEYPTSRTAGLTPSSGAPERWMI